MAEQVQFALSVEKAEASQVRTQGHYFPESAGI